MCPAAWKRRRRWMRTARPARWQIGCGYGLSGEFCFDSCGVTPIGFIHQNWRWAWASASRIRTTFDNGITSLMPDAGRPLLLQDHLIAFFQPAEHFGLGAVRDPDVDGDLVLALFTL